MRYLPRKIQPGVGSPPLEIQFPRSQNGVKPSAERLLCALCGCVVFLPMHKEVSTVFIHKGKKCGEKVRHN